MAKKTGGKSTAGEDPVEAGEALLRDGKFRVLLEHCKVELARNHDSVGLWKLQGVAHGNLGNAAAAQFSFFSALKIAPRDPMTLANYVTSCFDLGDKKAAAQATETFLPGIDYDGKKHVLEAMMHAVTTGQATVDDLPPIIVDLMNAIDPSH